MESIIVYQTSYSQLRENAGISKEGEFGFDFVYSNGTMIGTEDLNPEFLSRGTPIKYVDKNLNIKYGRLITKVWWKLKWLMKHEEVDKMLKLSLDVSLSGKMDLLIKKLNVDS